MENVQALLPGISDNLKPTATNQGYNNKIKLIKTTFCLM
jgi:hypothetical protein